MQPQKASLFLQTLEVHRKFIKFTNILNGVTSIFNGHNDNLESFLHFCWRRFLCFLKKRQTTKLEFLMFVFEHVHLLIVRISDPIMRRKHLRKTFNHRCRSKFYSRLFSNTNSWSFCQNSSDLFCHWTYFCSSKLCPSFSAHLTCSLFFISAPAHYYMSLNICPQVATLNQFLSFRVLDPALSRAVYRFLTCTIKLYLLFIYSLCCPCLPNCTKTKQETQKDSRGPRCSTDRRPPCGRVKDESLLFCC